MDAGQKFYTADAGGPDGVYALMQELTATGIAGDFVTYDLAGEPRAISLKNAFLTREAAKRKMIEQLRRHRESVVSQIDRRIAELEKEIAS